ncbi:MAG: hypothetical protein WED83_09045 [Acidimicrobiia bacterium]
MTLLEDRLEQASQDVRRGVDRMQVRSATSITSRHRRQRGILIASAVSAVVLAFVGVGSLTGGPGTELAGEPTTPTTVPSSTPTTGSGGREDVLQTPNAALWAESFVVWVDWLGYEADEVEFWETATSVLAGGSVTATVEDKDGHMFLLADFQSFAEGEHLDDPDWQMEVAGSTTPGVDTGEGALFRAETADGAVRVSLVTDVGLITIEVGSTDRSLIPDVEMVEPVALEMGRIARDLVGNNEDGKYTTTTAVFEATEPTDGDWIQLASDLWIARVEEESGLRTVSRLWIKTDTYAPTPAPSTDTRTAVARAGESDLIILVVEVPDQPLPRQVTVRWSDGESETGDLVPSSEAGIGIVRLAWREGVELVDVVEAP